jgi:hypothetical protein
MEDKGGHNQSNSPAPSYAKLMEGGRRASMIIVLGMNCPWSHISMQGKETREDPTKLHFPFSGAGN